MHVSEDSLGQPSGEDSNDFRRQAQRKKQVALLVRGFLQVYLAGATEALISLYYSRDLPPHFREEVCTELKRRLQAGEIDPRDCPFL